jgi:hypothetical protein
MSPGYTKAIIIQSKKLYHSKDKYSLYSRYEGFKEKQFLALKQIASRYCWDGVVYFLYNPKLAAFSEDDAKILRALETRMISSFPNPLSTKHFWHPEMEYLFHKTFKRGLFPFGMGSGDAMETKSPDELLEQRKKVLEFRPGLRVFGISDMSSIVGNDKSIRSSFHLEECYQYAFSDCWWGNSGTVPFLPFSSYIVDMFMAGSHGCDNINLIRIAEGFPPEPEKDESNLPGISVRHTLKITVRNTLPERDMMFHH